jgi:lipopolysaccharide transport system ATP-binding protein
MPSRDSEVLLECVDLRKSFNRRTVRGGYTTLKTQLVQAFSRRRYKEAMELQKLNVLKGLSFTVSRGETVGIIGRNGAGKSTLLKILTGIYKPTSGTITRHGRISALLELGAGFHPEFSGRENIYMNGMILGLSRKELEAREQSIIDFAEMQDFIDAPVRTYSSGMYMRLAFAVAVNVDPDILIIDEVLSVGDEHFQRKSKAKLDEFKHKGIGIILVTHDLGTVRQWCNRAIWLHEGTVADDGDPAEVVAKYRDKVAEDENKTRPQPTPPVDLVSPTPSSEQPPEPSPVLIADTATPKRHGDKRATIEAVRVVDKEGQERSVWVTNDSLTVEIDYKIHDSENVEAKSFGVALIAASGEWLFGTNTKIDKVRFHDLAPRGTIRCRLASVPVVGSAVRLDVAIEDPEGRPHDYWIDVLRLDFVAKDDRVGSFRTDVEWQAA